MDRKHTIPILSLIVLASLTIYTGINPASRVPWLLEVAAVWVFVLILAVIYRKTEFSNYVYVLLLIFMMLPIIGGYFSFDKVPFGNLLDFTGQNINQYDRLVHLMFGLLITPFLFELIQKTSKIKKGIWLYILPFTIIMALGAIYEIIEWSSALILSPENVSVWVGNKGDQWDPQKDMLMGGLGSIISTLVLLIKKKLK